MAKRTPRAGSFLFDVDAFRFDPAVLQMSPADRGIYVMLLCSLWKMERAGVCPDSDSVLCQLAGCSLEEWAKSRPQVVRAFDTTVQPGFWVQKRMVQTKLAQDRFMDRQRESGKRGGKARATNQQARVATILPLGSLERASSPSVSVSASASGSESASVEKKKRQKREAAHAKPTMPSLEEALAFARSDCPTVDGERWWNYQAARGWKTKAGPIVDWHAAMRTWVNNGYDAAAPNGNGNGRGRRTYLTGDAVLAFARQERMNEEASSGEK